MHVKLTTILNFEEEDSQLRFDEPSRRLVLIKHREFVAISVDGLPPIRCNVGGKLENVRFSLNHRLAAVQRSDIEIEFVDLLLGNTFAHTCKGCGSKSRFRILSYQWTGKPVSDFVVVTTAGVEFYIIFPDRAGVKLVKSLPLPVAWCVYSEEGRLLLLATGAQDNVMHTVQIQDHAILRIPKFEIALAPLTLGEAPPPHGQQKLRRSLHRSHVQLVRLYHMIMCAHIDAERQQLHLYQLFKDFVVRKFSLAIYSRHAALSVVDNLLVVHALDSKVALIFDVKINSQFPVTAPLPLAVLPADGWGPLYSNHWQLFSPDLIVDPQAGRVGRISIDLRAVAASSVDVGCLLHFLISRSAAQPVILEVFTRAIAEKMPLSTLSKLFSLLHTSIATDVAVHTAVSAKALPVASNVQLPSSPSIGSSPPPPAEAPSGEPQLQLQYRADSDAESAVGSMGDESGMKSEGLSPCCSEGTSPRVDAAATLRIESATRALAQALCQVESREAAIVSGASARSPGQEQCGETAGGTSAGSCCACSTTTCEPVEANGGEQPLGEDGVTDAQHEQDHVPRDVAPAFEMERTSEAHAPWKLASSSTATVRTSSSNTVAYSHSDGAIGACLAASAQLVRAVFLPAAAALPTPADPRDPTRRYVIAALVELLHSLQRLARMADQEAGELLLRLLAEQRSFYQIHQFVQYNTVPDSPRLVAQLFDMASQYPPAASLAVDILRRLGPSANEMIIDWMLNQRELLTACRFIRQQGLIAFPAKPLLDAAASCGDPQVFTAVYGFLLQRNEVWRGQAAFLPEEDCSEHTARWERECSGAC